MRGEVEDIAAWEPKPSSGLASSENSSGLPIVVLRTPMNIVAECEKAYDAGLLFAALALVVTVPDICSCLDGTDYRTWAAKY